MYFAPYVELYVTVFVWLSAVEKPSFAFGSVPPFSLNVTWNVFAVNTGRSVTSPYLPCTLVPKPYVVAAAQLPAFACGFHPPNV